MNGINVPPSYNDNLVPRSPAALLPRKLGSGPLSLVKITIVFLSNPICFSPSIKRPICRSYSFNTSLKAASSSRFIGYWPVYSGSLRGTHGVCTSSGHKLIKHGCPLCRFKKSSVLSTKYFVLSHRLMLSLLDQIQFVAVISGSGSGLS